MEKSDIEILQQEILKNKSYKSIKKHRLELEYEEFFIFLEPEQELNYSVGIYTKNKVAEFI